MIIHTVSKFALRISCELGGLLALATNATRPKINEYEGALGLEHMRSGPTNGRRAYMRIAEI